ncbi:MAG: HlyD family type I secretion periplasmic adaptor subunit, partial [Cohaesibacter sp.]|nr:HlyD family type I secretion periplasmic adaptor subunit [Cohaesibacter sp.]
RSRDRQKGRLREQVMQTKEQILGLEQERSAAEEEMRLIAKELSGVRSLYDKGLTSIVRLNNLQRAHAKLNGEAGKLTASIARARARISEIELQLILIDDTMKEKVSTEIRDVENKQAELIEKERKALKKLEQMALRRILCMK